MVTPRDPTDIFFIANQANAFLHSMSWGSVGSPYGFDSITIDTYLYNNQDNVVCTAAGNFGVGPSNIATPGV